MNISKQINWYTIVNNLTGIFLVLYIVSLSAFNEVFPLLGTLMLYSFMLMSVLYIFIKKNLKGNYYTIAILLYSILLLVSIIYTPDWRLGLSDIYSFITCAIIMVLLVNYLDSKDKIYFLINGFILAGIVLSILVISLNGFSVFSHAAASNQGYRLGGDIGNANFLGMTFAYSAVFALYMVLNFSNRNKFFLFYITAIVVSVPFVFLTGSKKALFILVFGIMLIVIFKHAEKNVILKRIFYFVSGIILLTSVYWLINTVEAFWYIAQRTEEMIGTFTGTGAVSSSDEYRLYMIERGIDAFANKPIFGNGVAYSREIFGTYSHNNYIEILMNTGLTGFLIFFSFYAISLYGIIKWIPKKSPLKLIALFIMISAIVTDWGLVSYYSRYNQILFVLISVIVCMEKVNIKKSINGNYSETRNIIIQNETQNKII
ncbi:O-antigen ligase family protein [Salipaludibacillus daqingensis]|uniref:O-antigen ligase family protein n=1 Tax=Salipaludibacillus daqingensis TaxID=3041001 RepID=UPI00247323FA|nr:O-antigen ligase family protein [Salipaludibacillus daqingensis]